MNHDVIDPSHLRTSFPIASWAQAGTRHSYGVLTLEHAEVEDADDPVQRIGGVIADRKCRPRKAGSKNEEVERTHGPVLIVVRVTAVSTEISVAVHLCRVGRLAAVVECIGHTIPVGVGRRTVGRAREYEPSEQNDSTLHGNSTPASAHAVRSVSCRAKHNSRTFSVLAS